MYLHIYNVYTYIYIYITHIYIYYTYIYIYIYIIILGYLHTLGFPTQKDFLKHILYSMRMTQDPFDGGTLVPYV